VISSGNTKLEVAEIFFYLTSKSSNQKNMRLRFPLLLQALLCIVYLHAPHGPHALHAQDIFLTPYRGVKPFEKSAVNLLSFSASSKLLAAADEKGNVSIWDTEENREVRKITGSTKISFMSFNDNDKYFVVVTSSGTVIQYQTTDFAEARTAKLSGKPRLVSLDPAGQSLSAYTENNQVEIFDLKANLSQTRIPVNDAGKKPMFMGYDRFGQQLVLISELGKALSWNPLNQKFLRELNLQSAEYAGSRSILHAASSNNLADRFVVGLQEVFIPKGGMQNRNQPERKNMIISYDWQTGTEAKRVPTRYRADAMAFGPGPGHVAFYSKDALDVWMVNLEKAEISSTITLPAIPSAIALSEDKTYLAAGTEKGNVNLYYIERNTPAEIKIHAPTLDRSYSNQVIHTDKAQIKGSIEGTERITKIFINDQESTLGIDGQFAGEIPLVPGKNKIRVSAQNTEMKTVVKDFYVTYEPEKTQNTASATTKKSGRKVALVVGNANYQYGNKLNNTLNDANATAAAFKELGFEVIQIKDGTYEEMKKAVYTFGDRIQDVDVSVFYYAGHGLEVDGTNYLVPVDADIQSALDIKLKTIPLSGVLRTMEVTNDEGLNMIILDACRNNPFPTGKRGGSGLAKVNAPSGTLIAYATDPGSVASDGTGQNGLYTGELVKQLKISQRIEDVFMNTRNHVETQSKGAQRPWEEARLKGVFYLK
jgi:WD40 repeat protein